MPLSHISSASDLPDSIEGAFDWAGSPEGYDYWNNYWNYLVKKTIKRNQPHS